MLFYLGLSGFSLGQDKNQKAPEPSYAEAGPAVLRHPGVDTDVGLYINHWRDSAPREEHGGLVERDILTPGDPQHPGVKGAVLKYIKSYRYAVLLGGAGTAPFRRDDRQTFFYVMSGEGRIEAGQKQAEAAEGTAVFVPAGREFRWLNPGRAPLEMIAVEEATGGGFEPSREISVGSYHDSRPIVGAHWAHIARPFAYDKEPTFYNPMGFIVVSLDDFDIAQPHSHPPGAEEIWLQLKGRSLLFFGNHLLRQEPGAAFLVPPNSKVPHASIHPGGGPVLWLYMGCRRPEEEK
ncbi:MAG: hypothetical protein A2W03_09595 [Candidatus Aminicenantes bacterium RBG_16_63_16]|nr:MAG: hypothetical protein A2W03_09595 [Candidatus Aminicenantes bacterium RBG_16_63_16]